jgi:hypothetical protein
MMPAQQNFQQNQATMQPAGPMAGGGINQPNPRNPQMGMQPPQWAGSQQAAPGMLVKGQGDWTPQQLAQNAARSGGITWNGNQPNFAGGANNWLSGPSAWRGSDPGDVSQAQMDALKNRADGLRSLMQKDQRLVNQGDRRPEGMDLLRQRMQNLRGYQKFMGQHLVPGTTTPASEADPYTVGYATDSMGGLSNSAQLMAMLAAQGMGTV